VAPCPEPPSPERVLELFDEACPEANGRTTDVALLGELACAAAYAFHEGRGLFARIRRGVARLRARDSSWTAGEITDEVMNLNWVTAIWTGKFVAALLRQGFDPAALLEEDPRPAAHRAIGAALAAAGPADDVFANEWEIGCRR
jgi:hypothetical protein